MDSAPGHDIRQPEARLALIELTERDGRATRWVDVFAWPVSIGRALDNHLVLDDPHVAAHHAVLAPDDQGRLTLAVLDSRNGVLLGKQRLAAAQANVLPAAGATLQLGATQLRLRLPGEQLAPEQALSTLGPGTAAQALLAGALFMALELAQHAISLDPGADLSAWLPTLLGLPVAVMCWCGFWALLSKLFRHRFDFTGHLRIAMPWLLGIALINALWPQLAAALDAPGAWHWTSPLQAIGLALLVRAHLGHALPMHPRAVTAAVAACTLAAGGLSLAGTLRSTDSLHAAPYMSTLPPPALRWTGTVPSADLVRDMAPLAANLARRAKKTGDEDHEDSSAGAEE
jgi:hypothetical protein